MKCNHTTSKLITKIESQWDDIKEDHVEHEIQVWEEVSAFQDIDTHRMKCSQCGKIDYYSESARKHYEEGIISPWVKNHKIKGKLKHIIN